jgi:hypothetical protein
MAKRFGVQSHSFIARTTDFGLIRKCSVLSVSLLTWQKLTPSCSNRSSKEFVEIFHIISIV